MSVFINILTFERFLGVRVVIPNKQNLSQKLQKAKADVGNLLVVSDFDFTISKFFDQHGNRGASCHRVLEECGMLSEDFEQLALAIQKKYYAHEVDPNLDEASKYRYMEEWVHKSNSLLVEAGLTRSILKAAVKKAMEAHFMQVRKYVPEFFQLLKENHVPILVFSAGIADVLEEVLQHSIHDLQSIDATIISNRCIFEDEIFIEPGSPFEMNNATTEMKTDQVIAFSEPAIHVLNKKSQFFLEHPFFLRSDIQSKRHYIVIGDSLSDVKMTEGIPNIESSKEQCIRIGFVNDREEERVPNYLLHYDILIFDDPGFEVPLSLLAYLLDATDSISRSLVPQTNGIAANNLDLDATAVIDEIYSLFA
jgi:cytosolic 5'-nucleotidase 3